MAKFFRGAIIVVVLLVLAGAIVWFLWFNA